VVQSSKNSHVAIGSLCIICANERQAYNSNNIISDEFQMYCTLGC